MSKKIISLHKQFLHAFWDSIDMFPEQLWKVITKTIRNS